MIDPGRFEVAGAGAAMLVTSLLVLRSGAVRRPETERDPEEPAADAAPAHAPAVPAPAGTKLSQRPRILTGEPAAPEARRSGPKRALKLVAGITTLAVGIAVGLIALVRALIALFDRI